MQRDRAKYRRIALVGVNFFVGCGGAAESTADRGESPSATLGTGGQHEGGGGTGNGGTPAPIDDVPSPYEPIDPDVSLTGDGRLEGGSVEGGQGSGWDNCYRFDELSVEQGDAADGETYLLFRSVDLNNPVDEDLGEGEVMFWVDEGLEAGEPLYVYFETKNFSPEELLGSLSFSFGYGDIACDVVEPATSVSLADLKTGDEWSTRCVEVTPWEDQQALWLWAEGEQFVFGVDAVRFGPPCH